MAEAEEEEATLRMGGDIGHEEGPADAVPDEDTLPMGPTAPEDAPMAPAEEVAASAAESVDMPPPPPPAAVAAELPKAPRRGATVEMEDTQVLELEGGSAGAAASDATAAPIQAQLVSTNTATAPDVMLEADRVTVGRNTDATLTLDDPRVSSEQFEVRRRAGTGCAYELQDTSRNGTVVNKKVVRDTVVELHDHDLIEVLPASKVGSKAAIAFLFLFGSGSSTGSSSSTAAEVDTATLGRRRSKEEATGEEAAAKEEAGEEPPSKRLRRAESTEVDELFTPVMCIVCQEVLHRTTSVQPCLHSFCSSCIGNWIVRASKPGATTHGCPVCRAPIAGVTRNHTLDGVIHGLLKVYPSKARAATTLAEMDSNDVLQDNGYDIKRVLAAAGGRRGRGAAPPPRGLAPFVAPIGPAGDDAGSDDEGGGSEDSDGSEGHSSDEEDDDEGVPARPPCFHCGAASWRTVGEAATASIATPHNAAELVRRSLQGNDFERCVLEEWLLTRDSGLAERLMGIITMPNPPDTTIPVNLRFDGGLGIAPMGAPRRAEILAGDMSEINGCRSCVYTVLRALVYALRERIPEGELPERARGRPVCWYGRTCRTQNHNATHAARFNHICEPLPGR